MSLIMVNTNNNISDYSVSIASNALLCGLAAASLFTSPMAGIVFGAAEEFTSIVATPVFKKIYGK